MARPFVKHSSLAASAALGIVTRMCGDAPLGAAPAAPSGRLEPDPQSGERPTPHNKNKQDKKTNRASAEKLTALDRH